MSLVDNGGNANFTMPVSPMYGGGGYGSNGFGWGDGSSLALGNNQNNGIIQTI